MNPEDEIYNVEVTMEALEECIATLEALQKLQKNNQFKKIISTRYFEEEAIRLVVAKSNPALQGDVQQKMLDDQILGIGQLDQYFASIYALGTQAAIDLEKYKETRLNILAEEADAHYSEHTED